MLSSEKKIYLPIIYSYSKNDTIPYSGFLDIKTGQIEIQLKGKYIIMNTEKISFSSTKDSIGVSLDIVEKLKPVKKFIPGNLYVTITTGNIYVCGQLKENKSLFSFSTGNRFVHFFESNAIDLAFWRCLL